MMNGPYLDMVDSIMQGVTSKGLNSAYPFSMLNKFIFNSRKQHKDVTKMVVKLVKDSFGIGIVCKIPHLIFGSHTQSNFGKFEEYRKSIFYKDF